MEAEALQMGQSTSITPRAAKKERAAPKQAARSFKRAARVGSGLLFAGDARDIFSCSGVDAHHLPLIDEYRNLHLGATFGDRWL